MGEWITKVKELPPENELVLAYVHELGHRPYMQTVRLINGKDKFFIDNYGREVFNISHWMPLPEPPESPKERTLDNCSLFNKFSLGKPKQYDGKCEGYSNKHNDEPCEQCKECKLNVFYEE